ncbi:Ger(x)C family spore germination protein [Viridibacillus sp. NPDC096237]|uniref:Ger(x)C family spore germination protein n=1 Tax=Viridibacillus sp. NPDC096237 TaxID=3390721 RepID=UPI003D02C9AF
MKRITIIIFLLSFTLLLNGCWSKRELNELAIVVALGIDKIDDEFEVSMQIVNPGEISSKQTSGKRSPVVTYHAKGKSVFEALRRMTTLTPRKPYMSHLQMLVIGKELAADGIIQSLDLLARDHEIRNDFYIVVADQSTANEVLNVLTPIEKVPANKMKNSNEGSQKSWATTSTIQLDKLINNLISDGKSTVLSTIEIVGDTKLGIDQTNVERIKTPVLLEYTGLSVFKEDKLVGKLNEEESQGYNYLKDELKSTIEIMSCPKGGNLSTEIIKSKTKVKGKIINGSPSIDVTINVDQNIGEVECDIDLSKIKTIHMINKSTSKLIKEKIKKTLDSIQKKYRADVVGFGDAIHRADPKEWKKIKGNWESLFPELKVNVKVKVNTRGLGTVQNSLLYKTKE